MDEPASALPDSTWADYASRRRLLWLVLGLGLAVALVIAGLFLIEPFGARGLSWPLTLWGFAVVCAGLRLQAFRCPRCQLRFFRRSPPLLALRRSRCVHCCLPKD